MTQEILAHVVEDGVFAAIAAIGFSSISNTPRRAYAVIALLAALGHGLRFWLMNAVGIHIITASTIAAFGIGVAAVFAAPRIKCPAEVCFFPALLPMIPGMYAYRTVEALLDCIYTSGEAAFGHSMYLLAFNGLTCTFILLGMVIGATVPVFIFKKISFRATR